MLESLRQRSTPACCTQQHNLMVTQDIPQLPHLLTGPCAQLGTSKVVKVNRVEDLTPCIQLDDWGTCEWTSDGADARIWLNSIATLVYLGPVRSLLARLTVRSTACSGGLSLGILCSLQPLTPCISASAISSKVWCVRKHKLFCDEDLARLKTHMRTYPSAHAHTVHLGAG